jgi:hypothetical protein
VIGATDWLDFYPVVRQRIIPGWPAGCHTDRQNVSAETFFLINSFFLLFAPASVEIDY